jgi:hypothetical protein
VGKEKQSVKVWGKCVGGFVVVAKVEGELEILDLATE